MHLINNGSAYTVEFEHWDLWCFSDRLCNALAISGDGSWFTFDKTSGDLIDVGGDAMDEIAESEDNARFYEAFSHHCQEFAANQFAQKGEVIYIKPIESKVA